MENEMKITPQDIIDKEFRVKFRGFDMAEVDSFLEEIAENFFTLTEENTLLNEKIIALQQDLENAAMSKQGQFELPAEVESFLEDIKQDTAAITAELAALKQDRPDFAELAKNLKAAVTSIHELAAEMKPQDLRDLPADLTAAREEFKQGSAAVAAELAALKDDRQFFDALKKTLAEVIDSAREAAAAMPSQPGQAEVPADLSKILEEFKQGAETIGAELAALKQEVNGISGIRDDIRKEIQELLASHSKNIESQAPLQSGKTLPAAPKANYSHPGPGKNEQLPAADIVKEPESPAEEAKLPDYRKDDDGDGAGELEFLTEDDILDVDKLRGIFQSVLDEDISDGHQSRDGEETSADLLFLEDDFIEDEHEPEVTFSLNEKESGKN